MNWLENRLPVGRLVPLPGELDQLEPRLDLLLEFRRRVALQPAARVGAQQHQVADALRMARRVLDRDRAALRMPEQHEALEPGSLRHGLEVAHQRIEGDLRVPVGKAGAPLVHTRHRVVARKRLDPRTPDRALPLVLEMREPVRRLEKRRPVAGDRVGNARAVGAPAEADLLVHRNSEFDPDYLPVYFPFSVQSNSAYWSFAPPAADVDQVDRASSRRASANCSAPTPNAPHHLPAEAGEARCSGSAAWAGWAPDAACYFLPRQ